MAASMPANAASFRQHAYVEIVNPATVTPIDSGSSSDTNYRLQSPSDAIFHVSLYGKGLKNLSSTAHYNNITIALPSSAQQGLANGNQLSLDREIFSHQADGIIIEYE